VGIGEYASKHAPAGRAAAQPGQPAGAAGGAGARLLQLQGAAGNQATSALFAGGGSSLLDQALPDRRIESERAAAGRPEATPARQSWSSWLYDNGYMLAGGAAVTALVGAGVYLYLHGSGGGAAVGGGGAGVPAEMPAAQLADVARSALEAASPQQVAAAVDAGSNISWLERTVLEVAGESLEKVVTRFAGDSAAIAAGTARSLAMGMDAAQALEANVPIGHFGLG
jgi:hypothetical protein